MKIERDERKFDFHGIGLAIKKAREREGMTQEQLGYIVDRDPRTIMYHENDGQHPSLSYAGSHHPRSNGHRCLPCRCVRVLRIRREADAAH